MAFKMDRGDNSEVYINAGKINKPTTGAGVRGARGARGSVCVGSTSRKCDNLKKVNTKKDVAL